jgi:hypothetical protein
VLLRKSDDELSAELDRVRAEYPEKSSAEREMIARGRLILAKRSRIAPRGEGPMHAKYHLILERLQRGTARYQSDQVHAQAWNFFD